MYVMFLSGDIGRQSCR